MEHEIRLARQEEKHEALCDRLDRFCDTVERQFKVQEDHNRLFYDSRDSIKDIQSKAGIIAGIGVFLSTVVSAIASYLHSK